MITYNPKDWFKLIVQFHKSDTFRILLPTMLLLGFLCGVACYLEDKYFHFNVPALTIFHQISGFIISLVLVFRINTAYDRWWEGRKHWGALINHSRSLSFKLNAMLPIENVSARKEIIELISSFPFALKEHLRNNESTSGIQFNKLMSESDFKKAAHKPNLIVKQLTNYVLDLCTKNPKTQNDYLLLSEDIDELTNICGACERIKNTPIPYSYSLFIKKIIFIYVITMPITFGLTIGYWSVPIVMIMFYAFASLELISEEIEDPFGTDSNDLPTDEISARIRENVNEILIPDGKN